MTDASAAPISSQEVRSLLVETGAMLEGHFLLSSGLHSDRYMQCALVLAHPRHASRLGAALAKLCPEPPDLILSPALGGIVIGQEVARALDVRALFAERENGVMTLRRGFAPDLVHVVPHGVDLEQFRAGLPCEELARHRIRGEGRNDAAGVEEELTPS